MKRRSLTVPQLLGISAVAASGCTGASTPAGPADLAVPVYAHVAGDAGHLGTHMSGSEETPPKPSRAQGQLNLRLSADGTLLEYRLLVASITDVTQAHIHLAPPGVPGPVIAWLYPSAPPAQLIPGPYDGVLADGVIMDDGVVGPLAGEGIAGLVAAIRAGNAYANVHTVQFPPGEIRGQVR